MPDLVDRREDIMLYARLLPQAGQPRARPAVKGFDAGATRLLMEYGWPGNLRQLKNCVTRATLLAAGDCITAAELPAEIREAEGSTPHPTASSLRDPAAEEERIRQALAAAGGNKSQAARLLGIDRKTLYNKCTSTASSDAARCGNFPTPGCGILHPVTTTAIFAIKN